MSYFFVKIKKMGNNYNKIKKKRKFPIFFFKIHGGGKTEGRIRRKSER